MLKAGLIRFNVTISQKDSWKLARLQSWFGAKSAGVVMRYLIRDAYRSATRGFPLKQFTKLDLVELEGPGEDLES
jgi:hypothetical protein